MFNKLYDDFEKSKIKPFLYSLEYVSKKLGISKRILQEGLYFLYLLEYEDMCLVPTYGNIEGISSLHFWYN